MPRVRPDPRQTEDASSLSRCFSAKILILLLFIVAIGGSNTEDILKISLIRRKDNLGNIKTLEHDLPLYRKEGKQLRLLIIEDEPKAGHALQERIRARAM
jgi:hypothetical protein